MPSRAVIVDDSSSRIQYEGSWIQDSGSRDQIGNYGPTFNSTLHGTQTSAGFSFSFSGTSVKVFGSNNPHNDQGVLDPKWECFVDNISIGATEPFQYPENNWLFCEKPQLEDGPHILTVKVTVTKKQMFWFDRIHYTPSPTASTEQQLVFVDSADPDLNYGSGWVSMGNWPKKATSIKGKSLEFEFTGVSLSWFGFIPKEFPGKSTAAEYAIDNGSPETFILKGQDDDKAPTAYNQRFFKTPTLPLGRHKLVVFHNGDNATTPLTLDYLVVQNGTFSSNSSNGSDTNPANAIVNVGKITNRGPIVGVVSAIVVIFLLLLAFFFWWRKQRQNTRDLGEDVTQASQVHPFPYQPDQYAAAPQSSNLLPFQYGASAGQPRRKPTGGSTINLPPTSSTVSSHSLAIPSPVPQSMMSGRAHEAMSQRGHLQVRSSVALPVVRHEDSGLRIRDDNPEEAVELPPLYTVE